MTENTVGSITPSLPRDVLCLLRPKHWIKNGVVLAPLLFSAEFTHPWKIWSAAFAVMLFCIAASAVYVVNDIHDREHDARHPLKSRLRPLAAGRIRPTSAWLLAVILYVLVVIGGLLIPAVLPVVVGYVVLNFAYTHYLKQQPVIDIFTIALGFVLRIYAGALAISVPVSGWMFITTLCLALYLAAIKRRQELRSLGSVGRPVLNQYSEALVERYAEMSATGALVFYSMFVVTTRPGLVVTIPLVLFGLFRYWYVVDAKEAGESPTDALTADWQLLVTVILWVSACGWSLTGR